MDWAGNRAGSEREAVNRAADGSAAGRSRPLLLDANGETTLAALRASEERFQLAVRATDDGIWDRDLVTGESYLSPRWRELLGYEAHEIPDGAGQFEAHLHPSDHARVSAAMQRHLETREPYRVEYRLRTKSGEYRWFHTRGQATFNAEGKPIRITGAIRDITAERDSREALIRQQDLYAALQRTNRAIVLVKDCNVLLQEICRIAVDHGHFTRSEIGLIDDETGAIELAARHGSSRNMVRTGAHFTDSCTLASCKVTADTVRIGHYQVVSDFLGDPRLADRKRMAMETGIRSMASFPLHEGVRVLGALNLYGDASDSFSEPLIALLSEMAMDISFALGNLRRDREYSIADQARRASEEQLRLVAANIPHVFWVADLTSKRMSYISPAYEVIFGRSIEALYRDNADWIEAVHPLDRDRVRAAYYDGGDAKGEYDAEYRIVHPNGSVRWVHARAFPVPSGSDEPDRITGIVMDITGRRELESRLNHLVHFDSLTGLPNRLLFHDRLGQALARAQRMGSAAAVMFINIDHFKLINETLGHAVGNQLLQDAALRISRVAGSGNTVARLGADEFAVMISDLPAVEDAVPMAQQVMTAFEQPFDIDGNEVFLNISIGIASYPTDSDNADALLRNADIAMHRAKELGRGRFQFYAADMNARSVQRLTLGKHLRRALERNEFTLEFQPKAELSTGAITGFEALLRWNNPQLGDTPPAGFIPVLEENGQIVAVGEWILASACQQIQKWMEQGITPVPVAVNLSARQILQSDVDVRIASILDKHGVDPRFIELEVTESVLMQHQERVAIVLRNLKDMGIRLAIDDFGTGYSSLSYLRSFPLDTLKIDRSFVRDVIQSGETALITQAVIAMALKLQLRVVAEGVETEAQLAFLASCGCDEIQGFYFSPAVSAEESTQMLIDQVKLELPASGADVNTRTLLLVDDDARILAALKRVLRRDGYSILTASTAAEALELLACNTVAVVVTDQRMPEMTGVEFLRRVKDLYPDAVRIMLSGYTDFQSITDAINRGAVYKFLTKPWDDKHLRAIVREAFRRNAQALEAGPSQRKALAAGTQDEPQQPAPDPASHSQGER